MIAEKEEIAKVEKELAEQKNQNENLQAELARLQTLLGEKSAN